MFWGETCLILENARISIKEKPEATIKLFQGCRDWFFKRSTEIGGELHMVLIRLQQRKPINHISFAVFLFLKQFTSFLYAPYNLWWSGICPGKASQQMDPESDRLILPSLKWMQQFLQENSFPRPGTELLWIIPFVTEVAVSRYHPLV